MIQNLHTTHSDHGGAPSPFHDVFSTDHFRMFQFKVRSCPRGRSHDWTECPYAHPSEKARRRDPRKHHYSATPCSEFRKGNCNRGDTCHFAHGVFECWLHPSRYRTQLCNDGTSCRRRICFFAHTAEQLRLITQNATFVSSPTSVLNSSLLSDSPPGSLGNSRLNAVRSMLNIRLEEESAMVRVESGRELRERIYAKLGRENSIVRSDAGFSAPVPDIGWVSELVM